MERESVLSLATIQTLFNKFFRRGQKLFRDLLPRWIVHPDANRRLFGIDATQFNALAPNLRGQAADGAHERLHDRFDKHFQRRHDCIHNCDRPRVSPQPLAAPQVVQRVIEDVEFLVRRCDEHIQSEFRQFLLDCGCPAAIAGQVSY
jgi:hypothetical protein